MVIFFLMIRLPPRYTRTDTLFPYTTLFRSAVVQLCALSRRPSRTPDSFFPEQRPWRGPSERMNLSRTLSTSVIALALSVPLVLMARSGDGLPATSRVDQATTSKLRSEEHTSELQSLMRISYAVFCLKKKNTTHTT